MTGGEQIISGLSFIFWGLFALFGWVLIGHGKVLAANTGSQLGYFYHDSMAAFSEGWTYIFLAIMGIYNAIREALMAIEDQCSMVAMEVIHALLYVTAGVTILAGPWAVEDEPLHTAFTVSASYMMTILSVGMGIAHIVVGIMRPHWRAEAARYEALMANS